MPAFGWLGRVCRRLGGSFSIPAWPQAQHGPWSKPGQPQRARAPGHASRPFCTRPCGVDQAPGKGRSIRGQIGITQGTVSPARGTARSGHRARTVRRTPLAPLRAGPPPHSDQGPGHLIGPSGACAVRLDRQPIEDGPSSHAQRGGCQAAANGGCDRQRHQRPVCGMAAAQVRARREGQRVWLCSDPLAHPRRPAVTSFDKRSCHQPRSGAAVTLYEAEARCGGHTLTDDAGGGVQVDLGFQVRAGPQAATAATARAA